MDALIGKRVTVVEEITAQKLGKVKIGSEIWKAFSEDESISFKKGDSVTVVSVDGAKVKVKMSASD